MPNKVTLSQSTSQNSSQYFPNKNFEKLFVIEEEISGKPPHLIIKELYKGWHFQPCDPSKTHLYYENILVQTGSVIFKHYPDPKDPNFITHSTAQILKVLRLKDWGNNPNTPQRFPLKITTSIDHCPFFTYWDYQTAWYNAFFKNNSHMRHSWLIFFKYETQYKFPNWFLSWWNWFGPSSFEILPEQIKQL